MSFADRAVELLLPWRETRTPADARHVIASWAARSLVQYFVVERIAAIAWQTNDVSTTPPTVTKYDYAFNFISDLGANACQTQDFGAKYHRWICSPLFPVVDLSFIFLGVGVLIVAALITSEVLQCSGNQRQVADGQKKLKHLATHGVRLTMGAAGLGLIGVGAWPENDDPTMHGNSTGLFLIFAVISLVLLGYLWWKEQWTAAVWIFLFAIVAAWGGIGMLVLNHNDPDPTASLGVFERMVVYAFIAGMFVMGYTLSIGRRPGARYRRHPRPESAQALRSL
ncbi:DUF998 domain-containing protein [Arthrobacter sp. AZCC_0090]|uniref:DUF998 domain-containing protein n=1 Tax=Arthrobacter sp. AZCC_0090 TaxID=2735881 RepID=UPI001609E1B6|nr:DUF998 domain-containing protein [Arthrobacter sp. AZCC_0090]MBB6406904.1 hypothetical protein [Arthrobacter sp. AZCC_0090]